MKTRIYSAAAVSLLAAAALSTTNLTASAGERAAITPVSSSAVEVDTDGDSLPDSWETNGYDADGDGDIDVDLPAMGATPDKKDLFVEMDYMSGLLASTNALDRIVTSFAEAPVANPDGTTGVRIHLDAGSARGEAYDLGGGNEVPYDSVLSPYATETAAIKAKHFDPKRKPIFHYMIWADSYQFVSDCSSGVSFGIPADTFLVTVGPKCGWKANDNINAGTFVHELGHNLGLTHGGTSNENYKPNYLSVMNYRFQFTGVPRADGNAHWGYSTVAPAPLNESQLNERAGMGAEAADFKTQWACPNGTVRTTAGAASGPIDWNCDGDVADTSSVDTNADRRRSVLTSQDNWENVVFGGGAVGQSSAAERNRTRTATPPEELTVHDWREMQKDHDHDHQH